MGKAIPPGNLREEFQSASGDTTGNKLEENFLTILSTIDSPKNNGALDAVNISQISWDIEQGGRVKIES